MTAIIAALLIAAALLYAGHRIELLLSQAGLRLESQISTLEATIIEQMQLFHGELDSGALQSQMAAAQIQMAKSQVQMAEAQNRPKPPLADGYRGVGENT